MMGPPNFSVLYALILQVLKGGPVPNFHDGDVRDLYDRVHRLENRLAASNFFVKGLDKEACEWKAKFERAEFLLASSRERCDQLILETQALRARLERLATLTPETGAYAHARQEEDPARAGEPLHQPAQGLGEGREEEAAQSDQAPR